MTRQTEASGTADLISEAASPKHRQKLLSSTCQSPEQKYRQARTQECFQTQDHPLGGLEQIGMNITAFEYGDSIVVVDCGLSFPEDDMLGIDLVIPDVTYLKENISKVKGFVITHGHEDHIGALPYVLKEVNVPIYSTKLTLGLITNKLKEHNLVRSTKLKEVKHGQVINLGDFAIEFIKTNHSIQDASAWQSILRQDCSPYRRL